MYILWCVLSMGKERHTKWLVHTKMHYNKSYLDIYCTLNIADLEVFLLRISSLSYEHFLKWKDEGGSYIDEKTTKANALIFPQKTGSETSNSVEFMVPFVMYLSRYVLTSTKPEVRPVTPKSSWFLLSCIYLAMYVLPQNRK